MISPKKDHFPVSDDPKCIWMTAGILSYRLCDQNFDCDNCPLDGAMRKHFSRQGEVEAVQEMRLPSTEAPETLREGLKYSRNHCWARKFSPQGLRLGVEPLLAHALVDPKDVVFPSVGQFLQKGQTCLWVVLEGGTLPLDSPCSGTVRSTNRQLADHPHLLRLRPFDEGWLYEVELEGHSLEEAGLMEPDQAVPLYEADEACFMKLLDHAMQRNRPPVGSTLADGGHRLQNLVEVLGPAKYFSILRKVYIS